MQLAEVEKLLDRLAMFRIEYEDYKVTKVRLAVALLDDDSLFGDDIALKARTLLKRWKAGSFEPAPLTGMSDDEFSSAAESGDEDEVYEQSVEMEPDLMRGILITHSSQGRKTYSLDKNNQKRDAGVFGHNGLAVGA